MRTTEEPHATALVRDIPIPTGRGVKQFRIRQKANPALRHLSNASEQSASMEERAGELYVGPNPRLY